MIHLAHGVSAPVTIEWAESVNHRSHDRTDIDDMSPAIVRHCVEKERLEDLEILWVRH